MNTEILICFFKHGPRSHQFLSGRHVLSLIPPITLLKLLSLSLKLCSSLWCMCEYSEKCQENKCTEFHLPSITEILLYNWLDLSALLSYKVISVLCKCYHFKLPASLPPQKSFFLFSTDSFLDSFQAVTNPGNTNQKPFLQLAMNLRI